jgi:hypothetical protein
VRGADGVGRFLRMGSFRPRGRGARRLGDRLPGTRQPEYNAPCCGARKERLLVLRGLLQTCLIMDEEISDRAYKHCMVD